MNKKFIALSTLAAILTASLTSEVPLLHKVATAQGETGLCAGVEMRKIDCPSHLWGTTTLSAVPATLLNLVAPVAHAGERYAHQCSKTTSKPTVINDANPYKLDAVNEFKKFYPKTAPKVTRWESGKRSGFYVKARVNGTMKACVFTGSEGVVRGGSKPRAGRNVKPIK